MVWTLTSVIVSLFYW